MYSWADVFSSFELKITHSTECIACQNIYQFETTQMYVELQVPEDNSNLKDCVEEYFNISTLIGKVCEEGCHKFVEAEKRSRL